MREIVIDKRYQGVPGVSLGGYVAGLAAKGLGQSAAVTLTKFVPPGSTVTLDHGESQVLMRVDGELAATAVASRLESTAPDFVTREKAELASEHYPGFAHHFFPSCFTCGPNRSYGDGLRIFPGPVDSRPIVATLWQPPRSVWQSDRTVASEFLWAALDCPAIWGHIVHGGSQAGDRAVSGRLDLHQHAPVPGDTLSIVVGWPIERQGRKVIAGAGIFSQSGRLLVEARQTLILTPQGVPLNLAAWAGVAQQTPGNPWVVDV